MDLRSWQSECLAVLAEWPRPDFLVSATPGAGKTTFALASAGMLSHTRGITQVFVVVHTDALRKQWCSAAAARGIQLIPVQTLEDLSRSKGYHGYVVTYQQMASRRWAQQAKALVGRAPTQVLLDEIHHAGEAKSWGRGLEVAFGDATVRLCLTGTPWRRDSKEKIPFVEYGETGQVRVQYCYSYADALRDGVCRPVEFQAYTGDVSWTVSGVPIETRLTEYLREEDVGIALKSAYNPENPWISGVLRDADLKLSEIRQTIPDAGGLVVASTQRRAREYADLLRQLTGESPTVVLSDDGADAKRALDRFRKTRDRWMVAVNMISEGVDVPRLLVEVFASQIRTPLFFRQALGRIVRKRQGEEAVGCFFYPQVQPLVGFAQDVQAEIRHQLEAEDTHEKPPREPVVGGEFRTTRKEAGLAGEALRGRVLVQGEPVEYSWKPAQDQEEEVVPRHELEKALRKKLDYTVKRVASRLNGQVADNIKRLNGALKKRYGPRKTASVENLEAMLQMLEERVGR